MPRQTEQRQIPFPIGGLNVVAPRGRQPEQTSPSLKNVRAFDSLEGRIRGGSRPGLSKYCPDTMGSSNRVQDINYVTTVIDAAPNTTVLGVRQIISAAVCNGAVYKFTSSASTVATTGGSQSLSSSAPFIFSAEMFGKLYYVDGVSYKIWDGATNTTSDWTPTAGSLPGTDGTKVPRLIESWRGRIVLSGFKDDPHNWFMSKLGDPLDWDYGPDTTTETQAVAGNQGTVGKIGDVIQCMIPYSSDEMIIGCDHSIWVLAGDPQAGGRIDLISDAIGMAFGRPWCKDGAGNVYFFSSRGEVYSMSGPDAQPVNISEQTVSPLLKTIDLSSTLVRLVYNEDLLGFNLFLSPIA